MCIRDRFYTCGGRPSKLRTPSVPIGGTPGSDDGGRWHTWSVSPEEAAVHECFGNKCTISEECTISEACGAAGSADTHSSQTVSITQVEDQLADDIVLDGHELV
eukprot:TRINITY_DN11742_c0_g1_i5.p1 TRINITY_DN11742_c0_g1~~TRINITY_DN11742_c0_g1_i5.p1  ORF type:complete len:104 (-),score=18.59 TRINITY_DN11742_c0_g1_i5:19-330(-)